MTTQPNFRKLLVCILTSSVFCVNAEETTHYILEPITVTAQKIPENLYDVPMSVSVVSGEKIEDLTLRHLEDVSGYVPNLTISQGAVFSRIFIRGIGSGLNRGFEQSVGIFNDGVYSGRGRQSRIPLLDVTRVEVLKGPQGILFGKNTTAGAVNIVTAQPTDTFESRLSSFYAPDHGEAFAEGVVSGALTEGLSARVAGRLSKLDGYLRNTALNRTEPEKKEQLIRGSFRWDPLQDIEIGAKYEYGHFKVQGRTSQIVETGAFGPLFSALDPAFESQFNTQRSVGQNSPLFGPDRSDTRFQNTGLFINAQVGNHFVSSITGYNDYRYNDLFDLDLSALSILALQTEEQFHQFSQEIRLDSPEATLSSWQPWNIDALEYLIGVYYQYQDLDIHSTGNLDTRQLNAVGIPIPGFALSRVNRTQQRSHSWSVFGRLSWYPVDDWRVTAGLRYTGESKNAAKNLLIADLGNQTANPALQPFAAVIDAFPHQFDESRSENHLMPMFGLQWNISDNQLAYFNFTTAAKSGGFDDNATSGIVADYEFSDEFAFNYEAGVKTFWLDRTLSLNLALFRTDFNNFQVSQFDGRANFVVGNAAGITSQGVELDSRWQITEDLSLSTAIAFLDTRYTRFPNATCTTPQTLAFRASGAPGACTQDLSGQPTPYAPDWSGNLYLDYTFPLQRLNFESTALDGLTIRTQVNVNFSDSYFLAEDLDPLLQQNAFAKLDVRIALGDRNRHWELAFVGKNLTNQLTSLEGNDIPVLAGPLRKSTERPRTVGIQMILAY